MQNEFLGIPKVWQVRVQAIKKELEMLKIENNESMDTYYTRLDEVVNQIKIMGEELWDKQVVEKILISLIEKFDATILTPEEAKVFLSMKILALVGSLGAFAKQTSRRKSESSWSEIAFKITRLTLKSLAIVE